MNEADRVIEIEWDRRTLAGMHPVYRKRCEQDECEIKTMYLGEKDVELDDGMLFVMEQPTQLVTRPLSKDDEVVEGKSVASMLDRIGEEDHNNPDFSFVATLNQTGDASPGSPL
jgi:hypothetical protein